MTPQDGCVNENTRELLWDNNRAPVTTLRNRPRISLVKLVDNAIAAENEKHLFF